MSTEHDLSLDRQCKVIASECFLSGLRKSTRLVTQRYDEFLRPAEIRATQVPVLVAIAIGKLMSHAELGDRLGMDRTTLSRNLSFLEDAGLIEAVIAERDRRRRFVRVTALGENKLRLIFPLWRQAQSQISAQLGAERFGRMLDDFLAVANSR